MVMEKMEATFDKDGYPTDGFLDQVAAYDVIQGDPYELVNAVLEGWKWPEYVSMEKNVLTLHTGGWSGNESIIQALRENQMFWILYWQESRRGGHYKFELPEKDPK
jgi:hypothetical protein